MKKLLSVLLVFSAAACSSNQPGPVATGETAAPAAQAAAAAEPDYPQPTYVIPPKVAPGTPHGPGFDMPMLELGGYQPPRPMEVLRDAHVFTADHPEVASYVPCYCGCGNAGHKNNADCFVKGRKPNGTVAEWEPHGVACAVCIDIAVDSMKMYNSGASVNAIRKKVQGDYRPRFPSTETPTPAPRAGN